MSNQLAGLKVAFLVADEGIEQVELTEPWQAVKDAGGEPVLISPSGSTVQAFDHLDKADTFEADLRSADARPEDYAAAVLPGGVANPDQLRTDESAVRFLEELATGGRPVAAICHGPWTLVETGLLDGRTLTSWPSLRTDVENAGARWVDEEVHVDSEGRWTLVTSRKPDDLPAFNAALVSTIAEQHAHV